MEGLMMDFPLTIKYIFERVNQFHPTKEVVSKLPTGVHRYTYGDFHRRVYRLANVLQDLGVKPGDRVATFAWNHYRHLELYYAVPCMGAVLHTLNIRLIPAQLAYIINHAEDKVVFVDASLLPLIERIKDQITDVENFVIMNDTGQPVQTALEPTADYEELMAAAAEEFSFPEIAENDAAMMCYTSGTTGDPKGALYSHRALYLHSVAEAMADTLSLSEQDVIMPVVPMFHANAWGIPYSAALVGATQVFPGPFLKPPDLAGLIQDERVTLTAGVPTLWFGLYHLLTQEDYDVSSLRAMVVGGAAMPQSLIEDFDKNLNIRVIHAWGMTETTPLGTVANLKSHMSDWSEADRFAIRAKQGMPVPGVEIRAVDEEGNTIPWDGKTMGELQVRGPWVIRSYYKDPRSPQSFSEDGWLRTGDVVTIDSEGYIQITDRTKDLVKSGGEWISSQALENAIMAHPKVMEAAVIAIPHPQWQERPLACVVATPEHKGQVTKEELYEFIQPKFAKWWMPDDIIFVEELPKTSVGKFDKKVLREQYKDYTT